MPRISAVVVTFDHADEVAACVDAALGQAGAGVDVEVVVVDNASRDATLDVLRGYGDRIVVVARERNTGYADGVNAGVAASSGDEVLLLNPDAVMDPGCVAALSGHLAATPGAGAAAALLRDPDGSLQHFARREIGVREAFWSFTNLGQAIDGRLLGGRHARSRAYADEWAHGFDAPLAVDCPAAACVLVRRALLVPRPMDPALPLFFNDAELWRRVRATGATVDVVPSAGAVHGGGTSIRRGDRVRMRAEWVASSRVYLRPALGRAGRGALAAMYLGDAVTDTVVHSVRARRPVLPNDARGTLGGLGLPAGAPTWLIPVRRVGRRRRAAR